MLAGPPPQTNALHLLYPGCADLALARHDARVVGEGRGVGLSGGGAVDLGGLGAAGDPMVPPLFAAIPQAAANTWFQRRLVRRQGKGRFRPNLAKSGPNAD